MMTLGLVAFLIAGCGGSEETTTAATTKASKTGAAAASSAGGASATKVDAIVGQVIVPTDQSPADFKKSIEARRPIVMTFYMNGTSDDAQVRTFVLSLKSKYSGEVDFYDYLYSDGIKYGDLTTLLQVGTTPTVVIINRQSQVQRAWAGWVDSKSIEQGIVEAKEKSASQ